MSIVSAKEQLWKIGKIYPTILGLLAKKSGNKTVGERWAAMLADCDAGHLADVCDEIASGERLPVPEGEPQDRLPFYIRELANQRRADDRERFEQHVKYHAPTNGKVMDWVRNQRTGAIAVHLGGLVKMGELSPEDNTRRMDELLAWDRGEPAPQWMEGLENDASQQTQG